MSISFVQYLNTLFLSINAVVDFTELPSEKREELKKNITNAYLLGYFLRINSKLSKENQNLLINGLKKQQTDLEKVKFITQFMRERLDTEIYEIAMVRELEITIQELIDEASKTLSPEDKSELGEKIAHIYEKAFTAV